MLCLPLRTYLKINLLSLVKDARRTGKNIEYVSNSTQKVCKLTEQHTKNKREGIYVNFQTRTNFMISVLKLVKREKQISRCRSEVSKQR